MSKFLSLRLTRSTISMGFCFITVAILIFREVNFLMGGGAPYQTGDWLINYEGGFVRRGLFGSILLFLSPNSAVMFSLLFLVHLMLYSVVILFIFRQLRDWDYSWLSMCLFLGPGALGFHLWDGGAGFRKELIVYAAIILLLSNSKRQDSLLKFRILGSLALFFLALFSWEPSALFLPTLIYVLSKQNWTNWSALAKTMVYSSYTVLAVLGGILSSFFHGSPSTARAICDSLQAKNIGQEELCGGAIQAIGWTTEYTIQKVLQSYPTYFIYLPLIIIATVPAFLACKRMVGNFATVCIVSSFIPLFFVVNDYGRWASLSVFALLFALAASKNTLVLDWPILGAVSPIFLFMWGLPHYVDVESGVAWPILGIPMLFLRFWNYLLL